MSDPVEVRLDEVGAMAQDMFAAGADEVRVRHRPGGPKPSKAKKKARQKIAAASRKQNRK